MENPIEFTTDDDIDDIKHGDQCVYVFQIDILFDFYTYLLYTYLLL